MIIMQNTVKHIAKNIYMKDTKKWIRAFKNA